MRAPRAFTLIELLVAIALLAALLAIGVPAFMEMVANNRMSEAANRIVASLHYARGEALRRNRCVQVRAAGSPSDWSQGWVIEVNASLDCSGSGYTPLRTEPGPGGALRLNETGGATALLYASDGTLRSPAAGVALELCDDARSGETGRRISVNAAGRPTVTEIGCP